MKRRDALRAGFGAAAAVLASPAILGAAAPRAVNIVMTQGVSGLTVHEVARAQGYFAELGIEPKVLQVTDGSKAVAALISGDCEICAWSGFNQLTPAIERGARIKILAGALNLPSMAMYSARPQIKRVADLEGRVLGIGAPGSVLHQMTAVLLRNKGVKVEQVRFRNVGSSADILKAVSAGTVDAGLCDVDVFDQQQKYGIRALLDGLIWKEIPDYTNQATYASEAAIRADRSTLVRILAAYARAYRFVSGPDSRAAFIRARQKATGNPDPDQAITQWNWIQQTQPYALDLVLSEAQVARVQQLNVEFKIQRSVLPFAAVTDMSLAREAVRLRDT